jgi:hypothetical protein
LFQEVHEFDVLDGGADCSGSAQDAATTAVRCDSAIVHLPDHALARGCLLGTNDATVSAPPAVLAMAFYPPPPPSASTTPMPWAETPLVTASHSSRRPLGSVATAAAPARANNKKR